MSLINHNAVLINVMTLFPLSNSRETERRPTVPPSLQHNMNLSTVYLFESDHLRSPSSEGTFTLNGSVYNQIFCILRLIDIMNDGHSPSVPTISVKRRSHHHTAVGNTLGATFPDMSLLINICEKSYTHTHTERFRQTHPN